MDGKMRAKCIEDIAELQSMAPEKLELRRLKYVEKVAKYTRKVAESHMELREAQGEMELAEADGGQSQEPEMVSS